MDAQQVIGLIEAAFPLEPLPEMSLHQAQLSDQAMSREISDAEWSGAAKLDAGRNWQRFGEDELMACDAALSHLEEGSFVYYLPAFLVFAIRHCNTRWSDPAESIVGSTVFAVTHRSTYSLGRFKRFSPEQRRAVVVFLEFISENGNDHERPLAEKALKRYWRTDAASTPLLIVP